MSRTTRDAENAGAAALSPLDREEPSAGHAPLAVTAMACRLPGAPDVDAFWRLLCEGRHAITEVPEDRWSSAKFLRRGGITAGRAYTRAAGIIDDLWDFDAAFFGVSPREAAQMDPQQRMMLEVAWRALEEAMPFGGPLGAPGKPGGLGRVGVYVGASTMDHAQRFATDIAGIDSPFMTGNTLSIISNRLAQTFGFDGPSLTIDTACASGLTSLHLAADALRRGEVDTALVGGVNALLQPWNYVGFSQAGMLSPTGLCRVFDASADGYVRAEGAVAVVLRRLADAVAGGERLRGLLRATGTNSDGRKAALSRPETSAQAALIAQTHAAAGLPTDRLAFLEAHGTGTAVGDPVEAAAVASALGPARKAAGAPPLPIGSAKSNIGHLEPAAGLVGLLKALLALENGLLPATLHVACVNPAVAELDALTVARDPVALPPRADGAAHAAAVSAFGFGGANAHAVVEAASAVASETGGTNPGELSGDLPPLVLTADTEQRLAALAGAWRARLAGSETVPDTPDQQVTGCRPETDATQPCVGLADGETMRDLLAASGQRTALREYRAVLLGESAAGLIDGLDRIAAGSITAPVVGKRSVTVLTGQAASSIMATGPETLSPGPGTLGGRPLAFLYAGNGAQWVGMGEALYADTPVYATAFDRASEALAAVGGVDPRRLRDDPALEMRLAQSDAAQAFLFALQVGLTEALAAAGLRPAAVLGHSVGEVAAVWAAGALSLEDAARVVATRARAVAPLHGTGGMAALLASADEAEALIAQADLGGDVVVAAINSPRSVTVSGSTPGISAFAKEARRARLACRQLPVAYPYHGPAMETIREALIEGTAEIAPLPATLPLFSSVTGKRLDGEHASGPAPVDPMHWWRNARQPVRFLAGAQALVAAGAGSFVEIGPRPVLAGYLRELASGNSVPLPCIAAMEGPGRPSRRPNALAAAVLAAGGAVDARFFGPCRTAPAVGLPPQPFERRRHRVPLGPDAIDLFGIDGPAQRLSHPLLGLRDRAGTGPWHARLDRALLPWIAEHRVDGRVILPAAAFAVIAVAAGCEVFGDGPIELRDLDIIAPLAVPEAGAALRTSFDEMTGGLVVEARPAGAEAPWQRHATVTLRKGPEQRSEPASWQRSINVDEALPAEAAEEPSPRRTDDPGTTSRLAPVAPVDGTGHPHSATDPAGGGQGTRTGADRAAKEVERIYEDLARAGLEYGPSFRLMTSCTRSMDGSATDARVAVEARVRDPVHEAAQPHGACDEDRPQGRAAAASAVEGPGSDLLPAPRLDGAFHAVAPLLQAPAPGNRGTPCWLPVRISRLWIDTARVAPGVEWRVAARLSTCRPAFVAADIAIGTETDAPFLEISGLGLQARDATDDAMLEDWEEVLTPLAPVRSRSDAAEGREASRTDLRAVLAARGEWMEEPPLPDAALLIDEIARRVTVDAFESAPVDDDRVDCFDATLEELVPALLQTAPTAAEALHDALRLPETIAGQGQVRAAHKHGSAKAALWKSVADGIAQLADEHVASGWQSPRVLLKGAPPRSVERFLTKLPGLAALTVERPEFDDPPVCAFALLDAALPTGTQDALEVPPADARERRGFDLAIWVVDAVPDPQSIRDVTSRLAWGAEVVVALPPAPATALGEPAPAAECARRFASGGCESVTTGWFDGGTSVLALLAARYTGEAAAAARMEDVPGGGAGGLAMNGGEEQPRDPVPPVLLLHDRSDEAAQEAAALASLWPAAECASLDAAVADPALAGGHHVIVLAPLPAQAVDISDTVAIRIEAARRLTAGRGSFEKILSLLFLGRDETTGGAAASEPHYQTPAILQSIVSGAISGLVRVLANERPGVDAKFTIETIPQCVADRVSWLQGMLLAGGSEPFVRVDRNGLSAPRIRRRPLLPAGEARVLEPLRPGAIESLAWRPSPMPTPRAGDVLIRIEAVGLNFRDVMWAQRRLPAEALELGHAGAALGMECVGTVISAPSLDAGVSMEDPVDRFPYRQASRLRALRPGDRVLALASGAFASHVAVDARMAVPLPTGFGVEHAAAIAVAGLTVRYALDDLARLATGETLLIHGGAGGVGLAALAEARRRGARVIASAGTPAKRRLLLSLGAETVLDSRDPGFADALRHHTAGRGCDVVLNSLAGDAQARSVECLAPFGRFVELGKRDIFENRRLALRPFARNLSFHAFDADQLLAARPGRVAEILQELVAEADRGDLPAPPVTVFDAEDAAGAFRLMQRSGHIGKIVVRTPGAAEFQRGASGRNAEPPRPGLSKTPHLSLEDDNKALEADQASPGRVQSDGPRGGGSPPALQGDWLIVGGTGGIGQTIAARLVRRGARRIWLTGRRGRLPEGAEAALRACGADIRCLPLDAADALGTEALFAAIAGASRPAGAPALEGVVHAAMILDDGPLDALTPDRVRPVLAAKLEAAVLLDRLTRSLSPRHFLMLGSIAARMGNPGQAAYAAANAGLEALARARRAEGLAAVTLALGPIGDVGHLADEPGRKARVREAMAEAFGAPLLEMEVVLDRIEAVLDDPVSPPCISVMPAAAAACPDRLPIARLPLFGTIARAASMDADAAGARGATGAAALAELPAGEAQEAITVLLRQEIGRILRMPPQEVPTGRALPDLGLDSLMAVDLTTSLQDRYALAVPAAALGPATTLSGLATALAALLPTARSNASAGKPVSGPDGLPPEAIQRPATAQDRAVGAPLPSGAATADEALLSTLADRHAAALPSELRRDLLGRAGGPPSARSDTRENSFTRAQPSDDTCASVSPAAEQIRTQPVLPDAELETSRNHGDGRARKGTVETAR